MIKLLVLLFVVLLIAVLVQLVRISELVADLKGEESPEKINKKDNNLNAILMLLFMVGELGYVIYQLIVYGRIVLPIPASIHGVATDQLLAINFWIIGVVFFATQILLFWYSFRYKSKDGRKATFYPDNHKLELIWTVTPTIVLVALIVYGLKTWNKIV